MGWVSCIVFPILNESQPTKKYWLWEKVAQMPLLTEFSWVGLALGWGVSRFHSNICMISNQTKLGKSPTPYYVDYVGPDITYRVYQFRLRTED